MVNLYKILSGERKEFVISKQLLRSGTSVGANVREAVNGQSKADFINKKLSGTFTAKLLQTGSLDTIYINKGIFTDLSLPLKR